jgi:hypothetical protein
MTKEKKVNENENLAACVRCEELGMELEISKEELILCNDKACEGDKAVDLLNAANKDIEKLKETVADQNDEILELTNSIGVEPAKFGGEELEIANAKIDKLLAIVTLTDPELKHITGGYLNELQLAKYYESFPKK